MPYIIEKVGDWDKMNAYFNDLSSDKLKKAFKDKLKEDGDLVVETIKNHITSQDLGWTPLAESTVSKKGNSTIYVDTGQLLSSIQAKEVQGGDLSIQIGAEGNHSSGVSSAQILEWLEYGTDKIPPRPLIRPTYDEMQDKLKRGWNNLFIELLRV